jgi:hypothetical protein
MTPWLIRRQPGTGQPWAEKWMTTTAEVAARCAVCRTCGW